MKVVERLPHPVQVIDNVWIPMPDGVRLAARIWRPESARTHPVPAILEYIPYRKGDVTRWRDEPMHGYFAGHGYAAVRVDLRGSGDSEGLLRDEYLDQELADGEAVIAWIAAQPWCTGRVGMIGISWGGFNGLQIAARRPPALGAVITVCSTDDRYTDDAHYMGGCLLTENLVWGSVLFALNARPPDPATVGPGWREQWLERLHANPLFLETWLRHPRRDDYWKHGSVCEDYGAITCPVFAVGGWADGYTNAVSRLLEGLSVPRKGLIGPWGHLYPHEGLPGPAIGFLQEALRWWDHWLKDRDTGILEEPMLRVWMQDGRLPRSPDEERSGRWVAEAVWPSPRITEETWFLGKDGELSRTEPESPPVPVVVATSPLVGEAAGGWSGIDTESHVPRDQRQDDRGSVCFDSAPLPAALEILGRPRVELEGVADCRRAFLAVRLNDVAPDGTSVRVSYGLLNLGHCASHEHPVPLVPGERIRVSLILNDAGHRFEAGHRIRVAVSTAYWPLVWPSPEPARITIQAGPSFLGLPVRPGRPEDDTLPAFAPPESAPGPPSIALHPEGSDRCAEHEPETGATIYTTCVDTAGPEGASMHRFTDTGLELGHGLVERLTLKGDDPLSARAEIEQTVITRRGDWATRVRTGLDFRATGEEFRIHAELEAFEGDERVFRRVWDRSVPRDGL